MDEDTRLNPTSMCCVRIIIDLIQCTKGNQAYSRLSTTHGHIPYCKLDSVVYAAVQVYAWRVSVDLSCLGRTIYARQFLGAKPPIKFRHR